MNVEIVLLVVLGFFILLLLCNVVEGVIGLIKSKKYKKIKAKVILRTTIGSKEWGEYFPKEYKKMQDLGSKVSDFDEKLTKIGAITSFISNIKDGNSRRKIIEPANEEEPMETLIIEYTIDGKKYYYYEKVVIQKGNSDPFRGMVGKTVDLLYDPNNPTIAIRNSSEIKTIIVSLIMALLLFVVAYFWFFY